MSRISSNNFYNSTVQNIQRSFEELTRLQNQLQTQNVLARPSDDAVTANQAIRLERNMHEVEQYQRNVSTGSDYLIFSDQILAQLDAPINTALAKGAQALNAEMSATELRAIGAEIQGVLDTIVSVGNSTLGDKSIFGGSNYIGKAFELVGNDVLFRGNAETFDISVFGNEKIQANITADQAFGARGTILDSERDLSPAFAPLSLRKDIAIDETKIISQNNLKVTARLAAISTFSTSGASSAEKIAFIANLDTALALSATYADNQAFSDAIRDAASTGFGLTASTLTADQTVIVTKTIDAAVNIFKDSSNDIVLKEGDQINASTLDVTLTSANTIDMDTLIATINSSVANVAGKAANGAVDNSNIKINAKLAVIRSFSDAGAPAVALTALATAIDAINTGISTTSQDYATQIKSAAYTAFGNTTGTTPVPIIESNATATQKNQAETAFRAARNAFAATEFQATKSRQGLVITHKLGNQVSIDQGSSNKSTVNDLELNSLVNTSNYIYSEKPTVANLGADRKLTLTSSTGAFLDITLRAGDSNTVIARRINKAINSADVDDSLRSIVASTKVVSDTESSLEILSNEYFKTTFNDSAEFASESAQSFTALRGSKNSIDDLRGGIGIRSGNQRMIADNLTTGYSSNLHIRTGDSLEYVIEQLNNLSGFDASINSEKSGMDITNMSLYSTDLTPAAVATIATKTLTITADAGTVQTITFSANTNTLSEMAEEINLKSNINFKFEAEVNASGTGLTFISNEKFSLNLAEPTPIIVLSANLVDHSNIAMIASNMLSGLGLSSEADAKGIILGRDILQNQVKLSALNNGEGISKGSLRFTVGSVTTDVDLSSASTLRDVKILIEQALPNQIEVTLNSTHNGFAINSTSSNRIRIQELNNGSIGRELGLIPAPNNSVLGTSIQGTAINPLFNGETLLKNLNDGAGVDSAGFVIQNGENKTTITFDTNGDGINDIRTVQEMVNYINQKSKQDGVYIQASIDPNTSKIKIVSQLSNTSLQVNENPVAYKTYIAGGIAASTTDATTVITSEDGLKSVSIDLTGATGAASVVSLMNASASASSFSFKARIANDGSVEVVSNERISVSDTNLGYTTNVFSPNPPIVGKTASDLGLLGAFSNKTLLSSLNSGTGIEYGQFTLEYGSRAGSFFFVDNVVSGAQTLNFYNENGSVENSIILTGTSESADIDEINANANANLASMGITAEVSDNGGIKIKSNSKFSLTNTTTPTTKYITNYTDSVFATSAKSISIDLEFAETLEDVKSAIEKASNNEVLVSFGRSNRIELKLASGDVTQRIEISELNGSSNVAGSLGLTSKSIIKGRELKNGITDILTNSTKLAELGIHLNLAASANSTENNLVFSIGDDTISIDMTSTDTLGNIISKINRTVLSDNGNNIKLEAKINDGKYLTVRNVGGSELKVQRSDFSLLSERLGLIPDSSLTNDITMYGEGLNPMHQADNFFSALTIMRDQLLSGAIDITIMSSALTKLGKVHESFLGARAESGARINRFEALNTRFEEEKVNLQGLFGKKTTIDIIEVTQKFLAQQQVYESGLSAASRVLGTSLFNFI